MAFTYKEEITLVTDVCAQCGVPFAIPEELNINLQKSGRTFYCPNAHSLTFGEGEIQKVNKDLEHEKKQHGQTKKKLTSTLKLLSAQKGQNTKLKKTLKKMGRPRWALFKKTFARKKQST